ncbi:hypothetical protein AB833_30065 [Chromatiales bacterium (ex Bugula neritina AB1)]|nr:hypothetical protein AB833_30065 [Chromatiales bacterium (ex Bugula neritina AB1)]
MIGKIFKVLLGLTFLSVLIVGVAGYLTYKRLEPNLPDIDALSDVELSVPLSVYTTDAKLIAEYGEKRQEQLLIENTPQVLIDAVIASEDARFYKHPGVDYQGLIRAGINLLKTGRKGQGGSTITMQVARNIYLSPEKTYLRKINEILLALKIERQISKASILELYLNIPYLGNRAYGAASAAKVYYGKNVSELSLAEAAMIAGLPKAPSLYNPIVNPQRALVRRNYVLRRMRELKKITGEQYREAIDLPVTAKLHRTANETEAGYVSEMARAQMVSWLGSSAYTGGYKVYTTIDSRHQTAANAALRNALQAYEQRHGLRLPGKATAKDVESQKSIDELLANMPSHGDLQPALVVDTTETTAIAGLQGGSLIEISWENMVWASPKSEEDPKKPRFSMPSEIVSPLDLIYVRKVPATVDDGTRVEADTATEFTYELAQMPDVEGALVSLDPATGKVVALVGGYDFYRSKFNRVTQAYRQPGSNFKPFIYSAALEHGDTAASVYNDTPVVLEDNVLEDEWRPRNYSGRFFGPTRLREALVKSRNLVSIRLLQELGIGRAVRYSKRFNFEARSLPRNLSLALGSGDMTPIQLASAYTVFANGGYYIAPRFIEKIVDGDGNIVYQSAAVELCENEEMCAEILERIGTDVAIENVAVSDDTDTDTDTDIEPALSLAAALDATENEDAVIPAPPKLVIARRVIDERNAFIMRSIMREVVTRGTAKRALVLGRADVAGKTGTTNDLYDAWFTGFNSSLVATAWIGYDEQQSLGPRESGGVAALPMWIDYMQVALQGVPEDQEYQPEGIATVRVDRKTGKLASPGSDNSYFEFFREEYIPTESAEPVQIEVPAVITTQPAAVNVVTTGNGAATQQPQVQIVSESAPIVRRKIERPPPSTQKKKLDQLF